MEWALSTQASASLVPAAGRKCSVPFPPATDSACETYVFAALQCGGWFVEPNPREQDLLESHLFELDAVARKPFAEPGKRLLAVEAKSGSNWRPRDTILLVGRGTYIGAEGGVFAYRKFSEATLEERVTRRMRELGFRAMRLPDSDQPTTDQVLASLDRALDVPFNSGSHDSFETWLYSHQIQQKLHPAWRPLCTEYPTSGAARAALAWNKRVYDSLPLVACPLDRLRQQDQAFQDFGRLLALRLAKDMELVAPAEYRLPWSMLAEGHNLEVQSALQLQQTARLAVLMNLVEIIALTEESDLSATLEDRRYPYHWRKQLTALRLDVNAVRWPLLWQTYLGCWGGFFVTSREEEELALLGQEVGLNIDDVRVGLTAFDTLFPIQGRQWHSSTANGLKLLSFTPAALRGVGVLHRLRRNGIYHHEDGRTRVSEALRHGYGTTDAAAGTMTTWYDAGVATLLRTLH
jgi:hypothetical protein